MLSSYILRLFIFSLLLTSDKSLVWVALRGITDGRTTPANAHTLTQGREWDPLPDPLIPRRVAA